MHLRSLLLATALAILLTGCVGSVGTSIDHGRAINATCILYADLRCDGQKATINLGGKIVQVTPTQITWSQPHSAHGALPLPAAWKQLNLTESFHSIQVRIDGRPSADIYPG